MRKKYSPNADWLRLLECDSPALSTVAVDEIFPQGPLIPRKGIHSEVQKVYEEFRSVLLQKNKTTSSKNQGDLERYRHAWVNWVQQNILNWREDDKKNTTSFWPDAAFLSEAESYVLTHRDEPKLFFAFLPKGDDFRQSCGQSKTAFDEAIEFIRKHPGAPKEALLTNGEIWTLLSVRDEHSSASASWHACDWRREPQLLNAFSSLFSPNFIFRKTSSLSELLRKSAEIQESSADSLSEQVQRAIEVLVQSLDRADAGSEHPLLKDISPKELYDAALTVMMRLVFILCAEERHLLPFGDPLYDQNYSLSTMRSSLQDMSDETGEETLDRRYDAWVRFLALCRMIWAGVEHPDLRLPALGGSLFDPDRYPFLEGRNSRGSVDAEGPLPIDNRTFLYLLEALQVLEHPSGAEFVSYGALGVEQIGHIYEGLLELNVVQVSETTLRLIATQKGETPEQTLTQLESWKFDGTSELISNLVQATGMARSKVERMLTEEPHPYLTAQLSAICGSEDLYRRVRPFINLLKRDAWGRPMIYMKGAFMMTAGKGRRQSGSYYTPTSLTDPVVRTTLEPLVYQGPAEGRERDTWQLRSPREILRLKICDPAMGSGAFLVQACRYLSERLCESWRNEENVGHYITVTGEVVETLNKNEPLSSEKEDRLLAARRLIAERCLYGVDLNPMAVELAKLSIWLITLSKGRPFGFLDHNLGCGNSLLGIFNPQDLLSLVDGLFNTTILSKIEDAINLRKQIRVKRIIDISDVEKQKELSHKAKSKTKTTEKVADALILSQISYQTKNKKLQTIKQFLSAGLSSEDTSGDNDFELNSLIHQLWNKLEKSSGRPFQPFHWCLQFPEVFNSGGFDAIIGNPPFIGNSYWKSTTGESTVAIARNILGTSPGKIDLSVIFHRRAFSLLRKNGCYGLLATTNISEGQGINKGLGFISQEGNIFSASKSIEWPGKASIRISIIHVFKGKWNGQLTLDNKIVNLITPSLSNHQSYSYQNINTNIDASEGVHGANIANILISKNSNAYRLISKENPGFILPVINGRSINNTSMESFTEYGLDSRSLSLKEIKERSVTAYNYLLSLKDLRISSISEDSYKGWKNRWWQYWCPRSQFFNTYSENAWLVYARLTKFPFPRKTRSILPNHQVLIFPITFVDQHPIFLSIFFRLWTEEFRGSKHGKDLSSISLQMPPMRSFPCPSEKMPDNVLCAAEAFDDFLRQQGGVTPAMNAFNDEANISSDVLEARKLMQTINMAVARAYGWGDLDLSTSFEDRGLGKRLYLKKDIEREILRRLVKLNHRIWNEQQDAVLGTE